MLESMTPMRKGDAERRGAFNKRQMDRLGSELELAKQLTAECGVELQLAVRALRETGAMKAEAVLWIERHRQRVAAELVRQRKQEKEAVAKRMKTEGIQLKSNGLRLKNWQPQERYTGWDGNTWTVQEGGRKMAAEEAASGNQGWGRSTMVMGR